MVARAGFEPASRGPKPRRLDRYPTGLVSRDNINTRGDISVPLRFELF